MWPFTCGVCSRQSKEKKQGNLQNEVEFVLTSVRTLMLESQAWLFKTFYWSTTKWFGYIYAYSRRRQWHPTPVLLPGKYSPMDGGAWKPAVHGVAEGQTWLSNFTFPFHFHALEKEMATHSSVLAWRIPGMTEPGGLPSIGSHRVGHDWSDLGAAAVKHELFSPANSIFMHLY